MNIAICAFLFGKGFDKDYRSFYLCAEDKDGYLPEEGLYDVAYCEYGTNNSDMLKSDRVNLSYYVEDYKGMIKALRDKYWGYSINEVPLKGNI